MALLDPLFGALAAGIRFIDDVTERIINPQYEGQQASEIIGQLMGGTTPTEEAAGGFIDVWEEYILAEIETTGHLHPENVEAVTDQTEGAAVSVLAGIAGSATALETLGLGQIDSHTEFLAQALAGLGFDDVTGNEIEAYMREGVMPALEARASKDTRSKFVSLPDAVTYALRHKSSDTGWLHGSQADDDTNRLVGSNVPVNPENLIEEWGIRDDNLPILEESAINAIEAEELLEEPIQYGTPPPLSAVDPELDRSGISETTKGIYRAMVLNSPHLSDFWESLSETDELVGELDTLVGNGEITPAQARDLLPEEVLTAETIRNKADELGIEVQVDDFQEVLDVLEYRWQLLAAVPNKAPTRSQIENSLTTGYTDLETARQRLRAVDIDPDKYEDILRTVVFGNVATDMQRAVAVGTMSPSQFSNLCDFAGIDAEAQEMFLAGGTWRDVVTSQTPEEGGEPDWGVETISGIGPSRGAALRDAGIVTIQDLAASDAETVSVAAGVTAEQADLWIQQAQARL